MKILVNLSTLKQGGGQNVGLNFLASLEYLYFENISFYFFVADGSGPHHYLQGKNRLNYSVVPTHPLKRIIFEYFLSTKVLNKENIDVIYTYFGIGVFTKKIPQVCGSADSNLYFPEIDFWSQYKGLGRFKKKVIDRYRIWGLKRANAIIFENRVIEDRSRKLFHLNHTKYIMPSISFGSEKIALRSGGNHKPRGLFLCGWQLNKNIMLVPEIASHLKKYDVDFEFVITAPLDNSIEHINFMKSVKLYNVENYINLIGTVSKHDLPVLYKSIDFVFLLSKLESFSNNIIESWHYKRLLIISDELWAKSICEGSALYVQRNDSESIAKNIKGILKNRKLENSIIDRANTTLGNYPTIDERTIAEINYVKQVYEFS